MSAKLILCARIKLILCARLTLRRSQRKLRACACAGMNRSRRTFSRLYIKQARLPPALPQYLHHRPILSTSHPARSLPKPLPGSRTPSIEIATFHNLGSRGKKGRSAKINSRTTPAPLSRQPCTFKPGEQQMHLDGSGAGGHVRNHGLTGVVRPTGGQL
eukprot:5337942-Pleurochrysis_carterae.AAC.1